MAAHRYWRLVVTNTTWGAGFGGFAELEFYDAAGSVITCSTPSASGVYSTNYAANAFDGNRATSWISPGGASAPGAWIKNDFGSAVEIYAFSIWQGNDVAQVTSAFKLQYSDDDSSWTDATAEFTVSGGFTTTSGFRPCGSYPVVTPAAGEYLHWSVYVADSTPSGNAVCCAELGLRESPGGSDISSGLRVGATADNWWSGEDGPSAFDGNAATIWSHNGAMPGWIGCALKKAVAIQEFTWQIRSSVANLPATLTIRGSNDGGTTWTDVATFTADAWTSGGQIQTFTIGGGAAAPIAAFFSNRQLGSGIYVP